MYPPSTFPSRPATSDDKFWRAQKSIYFLGNEIKSRLAAIKSTAPLAAFVSTFSGLCYSILSSIGFSQNSAEAIVYFLGSRGHFVNMVISDGILLIKVC